MGSLFQFQNNNGASTSFTRPVLPIRVKPEPIGESSGLIPSTPPTQFDQNDLMSVEPELTEDDLDMYAEFDRVHGTFGLGSAFAEQMERSGDVDVLNSETGAIVPVQSEEDSVSAVVVAPRNRRPRQKRSNELIRFTDFSIDENQRQNVRRARMLYDALRIYSMADEERRFGFGSGRRIRADLKAAGLMRDKGLWVNIDKRIVGSIPGVYIGDFFYFRMEMCVIGLHVQVQAGIDYLPASQSSSGEPIATSIVVSGGYEDDEDSGDVLIYTGHGGQDRLSRMANHQKLEGGNLALERSMHHHLEIRVIRGLKYGGSLTSKIYVYDGLYKIVDTWPAMGKSGFMVYKYKLVRIEGQPEMGSALLKFAHELLTRPLDLRPKGYVTLDLSTGKEKTEVAVFNDVDTDTEPLYYDYLPRMVFPPFVFAGANMGCNCVTSCTDGCLCGVKNGGEIAYDQNGFLLRGKPLIFECGNHCSCPPSCRNRVSQNGLKIRLEIFRSVMGWGVRTLDLIPAGGFICEYTGVVLTKDQAQLLSMNGDCLIYPGRFAEKWVEWGDLSQIYPEYATPTYPSIPPLDFAMDVSQMRNVACYINHSTCPNVMVQSVLYDHNNVLFPHLMLFAMGSIPAMRELCLDYGATTDESTEKLLLCN